MTVREMLARIGADELDAWASYERVYGPLGPARDDVLAAIMSTAATNAQRTKKDQLATASDFLPQWDRRPKQQSWQDQLALVKQLNTALGGTVKGA